MESLFMGVAPSCPMILGKGGGKLKRIPVQLLPS